MDIFWGDLHVHCNISYGYGSLRNALEIAREHLDFCAIIGHAMWPDIPKVRKGLEDIVSYHKEGFEKFHDNWSKIKNEINKHNNYDLVTFQGYEMHSRYYGDHHLLSPNKDLLLKKADSPKELIKKIYPNEGIMIPHHPAYKSGYRGVNWSEFNSKISPVIEVFSKHGCAMSDTSPYQYLHTMGPRDSQNTIFSGLKKGHHFGFVASTDHHAGYPGSYGDGKTAIMAKDKSRSSFWESLLQRKTYAVTGDKIKCFFSINGNLMGSKISSSDKRIISLDVIACDAIDRIVVYKNLKPYKIFNSNDFIRLNYDNGKFKVRIEMGWGRYNKKFRWNGKLSIEEGIIDSIESCFRGENVLSPSLEGEVVQDINKNENKILLYSDKLIKWKCFTRKNPTTKHSQTNSIILEIEGSQDTTLKIEINDQHYSVKIRDLINGNKTYHMQDYNSEAFVVHKAIPEDMYTFNKKLVDKKREKEIDIYHMEVKQKNNQFAWVSPIYVYY